MDRALLDDLQRLARMPVLLVACDYDGTLAPIVENPDEALPHRESVTALRSLAGLPDTHVAVISGRSLRDLATLSRLPHEVHLVGSHGSEFDAGFVRDLDPELRHLRDRVADELEEIAATADGLHVEHKPASAALHTRRAAPADAERATRATLEGPAAIPGVHVKHGKQVIELTVVATNKGTALDAIRRQVAAEATLFVGDDVTDEDAFAILHGPDLGIKVGPGDSAARVRVDDTTEVARMLALLCELRRAWIEGDHAPPIEAHTLLSDLRTVALVTPDARLAWMCHPRADSPAIFAELLGGHGGGTFVVHPEPDAPPISQRYVDHSMTVETRWSDLMVTDYLDCADDRTEQPAGRTDLVRVIEGRGRAHVVFAPRLDFGRAPTRLQPLDDGVLVTGTTHRIVLHSPGVTWSITDDGEHQTGHADIELNSTPVVLTMRLGAETTDDPPGDEAARRAATEAFWHDWAATLHLPGVATEDVRRGAILLRSLWHRPSGAILAAATTSLPEVLGGVRNWDYRYCWPRDAALTAATLVELGSTDEALGLLEWLLERVEHLPGPEQLRPLYPLVGDEALPEAVIPTLPGYKGSRPVRIGNAAEYQVQLDVFGPVVDLVARLVDAGVAITDDHWQLVHDMVMAVSRRWHEPDHGIWEERRPQQHHVYSKVMCWTAVDRALRIAHITGRTPSATWRPLRHTIAADVVSHGWSQTARAYTSAYENDELDAASLHIGLSGLLPATDPRFVATIRAVERGLRTRQIVYRYRHDDGLPGEEGGFLICTAWLIEAYVLIGQLADARLLLDRYIDLAGPTGLLAEEFDPHSGLALGNVPQAYSHLGLIRSAVAIDRAARA
ncbi:MAG: trehalose-phosphatase [Acidimicrobiales bacterium]|nr:trehalose-phosphatase [Acidimicrobiales bacterium]